MKDVCVMWAEYNRAGNRAVYDILGRLGAAEREKDRGSYYGSLSGLVRHILGGTRFFLGLYKAALGSNAAALKALASIEGLPASPQGELGEAQWKELGAALDAIDGAYVTMTEALSAADRDAPLAVDWYGGNPASVPLSFMLNQLVVHNTHHRGQISQILDSLKVDNDYSGISVDFLP